MKKQEIARQKLIIESFAKTFNSIKRIDEAEISDYTELSHTSDEFDNLLGRVVKYGEVDYEEEDGNKINIQGTLVGIRHCENPDRVNIRIMSSKSRSGGGTFLVPTELLIRLNNTIAGTVVVNTSNKQFRIELLRDDEAEI
jgi:hypothetical protein